MNSTIIGLLFITAGIAYGSLALDGIYSATLGWLVEHSWIKPPVPGKGEKLIFGRKPTIIFYSLSLIAIGIYTLWKLD